MPELLTQRKTPTAPKTWPGIDRNPGRLQFGIVGGFTSEFPDDFSRNPHIWLQRRDLQCLLAVN